MKRWIAMLLIMLLTLTPALAEGVFDIFSTEPPADDPLPSPVPDEPSLYGEIGMEQSITLTIDGEAVRLYYDASPQYSSIGGGIVQASYYAYGHDGVTLYELFLIFPDTAKPGMVITPEYVSVIGGESSVALIVSDNDSELYYYASLMNGVNYPEGSGFSIAIDSIETENAATTYAGRFSATLVALDTYTGEPAATLSLPEAPFRFTIGGGANLDPVTPKPSILPDDMRKV